MLHPTQPHTQPTANGKAKATIRAIIEPCLLQQSKQLSHSSPASTTPCYGNGNGNGNGAQTASSTYRFIFFSLPPPTHRALLREIRLCILSSLVLAPTPALSIEHQLLFASNSGRIATRAKVSPILPALLFAFNDCLTSPSPRREIPSPHLTHSVGTSFFTSP
jgi:hypothetical protein